MGLINSIKDHFTNAEFSVAPQMKVKSICKNFKETFGCTLDLQGRTTRRPRNDA